MFIQLRDILRTKKDIEAETVRLHPDDGESIRVWVEELCRQGFLLGFKAKSDPPPPGSGLESDMFSLMVQTKWQQKKYAELGQHLVCIDGTHNTTVYENMILTTLLVHDKWGHGIPVAWMLSSSGTEDTIYYFLWLVRIWNPGIDPWNIMSDRDWAQLNACRWAFINTILLLCWWHVLHVWQQHFQIRDHPQLWDQLKKWI